MNSSIAAVMGRGLTHDVRLRFILRHGIIPWGIVAGLCAAAGGALGVRRETASATPASPTSIALIAALCFVVWCGVAGWAVGVIRWELRQLGERERLPRRHKHHDHG